MRHDGDERGEVGDAAPERVAHAIERARARLARVRARRAVLRFAGPSLGLAALAALARPVLWPLADHDALWLGAPRALGLGLAILALSGLTVGLVARRKPSILAAARALDEALGLPDVVASGATLAGQGAFAALARARADQALAGRDVRALLPLPRLLPRARAALAGGLALTLACLAGAYDPALARVLAEPPRAEELASAAELVEELAALANETELPAPAEERRLAAEVHRALERGDRERVMEALSELRALSEERARAADEPRALARQLARHLDVASGADLEAQTRLLARRLRAEDEGDARTGSRAERERVLERLARAADAAARSGGEDARRMAEALSRAQAALSDDRLADAARALDEAAARAAALDAARARADAELESLARLLERVGRVERLMQGEAGAGEAGGDDALAALNGAPGDGSGPSVGDGLGAGDGPGDSGGLSSALAARLAALGLAEGPSGASPGRGGGPGGANGRPARGGLEPTGDVHARSVVREGEQAVQVLEGLGRNAEAQQTYAELYPSYGAVAEEALASPRIPAARRETIRRYFEAIRPGAEATPAGVTDDRATEDRATDDRATDDRVTDDRATEDRATEDRATDDRATDDRATEGRATREPAEGESR